MKDIKDYLHLYLGCEVSVPIMHQRKFIISGVQGGWTGTKIPIVSVEDKDKTWTFDRTEIKLVLRPLSDMSKEEAKELATIYTGYHIRWVNIKDEQIIFNYHEGDEIQENVFDIGYSNGEGFRYLLSKGFDLFGLIDAGLAIDKTKLEHAQ